MLMYVLMFTGQFILAILVVLLVPVRHCQHCQKRRSLLSCFISLDKDVCDDCIDIINQEIKDKRSI